MSTLRHYSADDNDDGSDHEQKAGGGNHFKTQVSSQIGQKIQPTPKSSENSASLLRIVIVLFPVQSGVFFFYSVFICLLTTSGWGFEAADSCDFYAVLAHRS